MSTSTCCSITNVNISAVSVETQIQSPPSVVVTAGIQGPPGATSIGGKGFDVQNLQNFDLLVFLNGKWRNIPQITITDGGNF